MTVRVDFHPPPPSPTHPSPPPHPQADRRTNCSKTSNRSIKTWQFDANVRDLAAIDLYLGILVPKYLKQFTTKASRVVLLEKLLRLKSVEGTREDDV